MWKKDVSPVIGLLSWLLLLIRSLKKYQVQVLYNLSGAIIAETKLWNRMLFMCWNLLKRSQNHLKTKKQLHLKYCSVHLRMGMKQNLRDNSRVFFPQDLTLSKNNLTRIYLWLLAYTFLRTETFHQCGRFCHVIISIGALTFPCISKSTICGLSKSIAVL